MKTYNVTETIVTGQRPVPDRRNIIKRLWHWIRRKKYHPAYNLDLKLFCVEELWLVHAGGVIMLSNGKHLYVMARSLHSLICRTIDACREEAIPEYEQFKGKILVVYHAQSERAERNGNP